MKRSQMLSVLGVKKSFGPRAVLQEVSLELGAGECMLLLGANGAGKTTLLKILATLLRASGGRVRVAGHDVSGEREAVRRRAGLVAHSYYIYEDLTALENLRFWATLAGLDAHPAQLRRVLAGVELDSVADGRVRTFSAGMKRRLALARITLRAPTVLLLDEPYDGLDQRGRKWLDEFLLGFKAGGGSVLIATHNFGRGLGIADRVAILAGGRIVLDRSQADLDLEDLHRLYALHTEDAG